MKPDTGVPLGGAQSRSSASPLDMEKLGRPPVLLEVFGAFSWRAQQRPRSDLAGLVEASGERRAPGKQKTDGGREGVKKK